MTSFEDIEFKCMLNNEKTCNDCDECILCYKCIFLQKRRDNLKVECGLKGIVDVHSTCHNFKLKGDSND